MCWYRALREARGTSRVDAERTKGGGSCCRRGLLGVDLRLVAIVMRLVAVVLRLIGGVVVRLIGVLCGLLLLLRLGWGRHLILLLRPAGGPPPPPR